MVEKHGREAWMALLHVRPLPGQLNPLDGVSGMGWALALAADEHDYVQAVNAEMRSIGLFVAEIEDLDRFSAFDVHSEDVAASFERLSEEWPVQYHTFHTTKIDDA